MQNSVGKAANEEQKSGTVNQNSGRVFLFFILMIFERDYKAMKEKGVAFVRTPVKENYGTVALFKDLYGNLCNLIEPTS